MDTTDQPLVEQAPMAPAVPSIEEAFLILQNAVMADESTDDADKLAMMKDVMKLKAKCCGGDGGEEEPATEEGVTVPHELDQNGQQTPAPQQQTRKLPHTLRGARLLREEQARRHICMEEQYKYTEQELTTFMDIPLASFRQFIQGLVKGRQRPRYRSDTPQSGTRREPTYESTGQGPPFQSSGKIPKLSQGATRAQVEAYYAQRR